MFFYGLGECAENALLNIRCIGQEKLIKGVIDSNKSGTWNGYEIVELEKVDKNEVIIITVKNPEYIKQIKDLLFAEDFKKVYYFNCLRSHDDFLNDSCTLIENWGDAVLPHVEMHACDYCNLNCRGCTHYSALFEKKLPVYEDQIKDVLKLKSKCSHIIRFYIMGGEPFLNPNIQRYITGITTALPKTDVWIVTNGLLILSLGEDVLELISKLEIVVSISEYEPTHKIIGKIMERLEKFNVSYDIRPYNRKQKFIKPLSLSDNSMYENTCISNGCINIWSGKIARCPSLMYIDKLNQYFGINLPNEGIMDLDSCPSGEELIEELNKKIPLCKHCVDYKIDWQQCDIKSIKLEDFVVEQ